MEDIKFEDLPRAVELILNKIIQLENELAILKEHLEPKKPTELMTRQETANYFKIDPSTLWNWTKKGKLNSYGIGYRVYYKRSELDESLIRIISKAY